MRGNKFGTVLAALALVIVVFFLVPAWLGYIDPLASRLSSDWKIYHDQEAGFRINYPQSLPENVLGPVVSFGSQITVRTDSEDECVRSCREKSVKKGFFNGVYYEYREGNSDNKIFYRYRFRTLTGWYSLKLSEAVLKPVKIGDTVNLNKIIAEQDEPAFEIQKNLFAEMAKTIRLAPVRNNKD